jgi:Tfp pilus assembly protein PilZ
MSSQRYKVRVAAKFLARSQDVTFLTDYLSLDGVFVRTDSPPPVMELLRIEFTLPSDGTNIVLHGMVTEIVLPSAKHSAPGVEIAFFAKGGEAGRRWDELIAYLHEQYPESLERPVTLARETIDPVRRAHPRFVFQSPIQVGASDDGSFTVSDISDGGMFIKTTNAFTVGSDLRITLRHHTNRAGVPIHCIVRRRAFGSNAGIGVEFRNVNDEQRAILRELIQSAQMSEPVQAKCEEIFVPVSPRRMKTLPCAGSVGTAVVVPAEGSWALLDHAARLEHGW